MITVRLEDGKYEFDLADGQMIAARRHGVPWPAGHEERFNNSFIAALNRIAELEEPHAAGPAPTFRPIQQEWTTRLGLRHQGVLMAAVRGCDTAGKNDATKTLTRYYRSAVLNAHCGDPTKAQSFIEVPPDDPNNRPFHAAVKGFFAEMDALPNHYIMHFLHAAEIVGYHHPEVESRVTGIMQGTLHRQPLPDSEAASFRKAVRDSTHWNNPNWFEVCV